VCTELWLFVGLNLDGGADTSSGAADTSSGAADTSSGSVCHRVIRQNQGIMVWRNMRM
jgi:hypothetical protein